LLGLASFLGPFCFGIFGDFIPKGKNVRPKQASGKLTSGFKDMRPKWENVNIRSKKGEVSSRGSLDDGKHPGKCKWI
jgi:hypothetical protein